MAVKLAIVGRPNVGKSTLFNRLAGKKLAIVDDQPGVTRDRREADGRLGDIDLVLIDTAGFETVTDDSLEARMRAQTEAGIDEADLCLFLIDARAGVTPVDHVFADLLRRSGRPVILAANKAEGREAEAGIVEAYALGLGEPIPISGEHGEGMSDLFAAMVAKMGEAADPSVETPAEDVEKPPLRLAIIGRPNAGKSTLVNALIGEERLLVGPEAGITRDSIGIDWEWEGRPVRLVDTAGMRRKARVQEKLESLSVADTLRAIRFAEVCLLVMDANEAFEKQDLQIADLVAREGRALIYVLAKWDQVDEGQERLDSLRLRADKVLPQTRGAPMVPISSLSGRGLDKLMPAVLDVHDDWNARIKTRDLNDWMKEAVTRQPPPAVDGRRVKPRYIAQLKARPPTFVLIATRAAQLPDSYVRYLVNGIRKAFDMPAVPIRFMVRAPKNPYAENEGDSARSRVPRTGAKKPPATAAKPVETALVQPVAKPKAKPAPRGRAAKAAAKPPPKLKSRKPSPTGKARQKTGASPRRTSTGRLKK